MKKHLLLPALAAIALAGCTSSEVLDEGVMGNAIGFTNVVNKTSQTSRAIEGDLTSDTFDTFLIYGYYTKEGVATPIQIFNGVPVLKGKNQNNEDVWTYDDTRYWVPGCTYYFYAYSCGDVSLAADKGNPSMSLFDAQDGNRDNRALTILQYLCDKDHQHDLVYAENENVKATDKGNPEVALPFSHALCKVKAIFSTDFADGYRVLLSNVRVSSFSYRADFNVGSGVWSNFNDGMTNPSHIMLNVPEGACVTRTQTVTSSEAFVIPRKYDNNKSENVRLHFSIQVQKNTGTADKPKYETILERNIVGTWSPQWEKGNLYTYNINIAGSAAGVEPIVFAAQQSLSGNTSWDTSTSLDMVFGVDANNESDKTTDDKK